MAQEILSLDQRDITSAGATSAGATNADTDPSVIFVLSDTIPNVISKISPETMKREEYIKYNQGLLYKKYKPLFDKLPLTTHESKNVRVLLKLPLKKAAYKIPFVKGLIDLGVSPLVVNADICSTDHPGAFDIIARFFEMYGSTPDENIPTATIPLVNNKCLQDSFRDAKEYECFLRVLKDDTKNPLIETQEEMEIMSSLQNITGFYQITKLYDMVASYIAFTTAYYGEGDNKNKTKLRDLYGAQPITKEEFNKMIETFPDMFLGFDTSQNSINDAWTEYEQQLELERDIASQTSIKPGPKPT